MNSSVYKEKKVLLHICCGVCAFACIETLQNKGFKVRGLFFNPNISPRQEYLKRYAAAQKVSKLTGVEIEESPYQPQRWRNICDEYKDDGEGGRRCLLCYRLRLSETLAVCRKNNFDYFTSTLTVSPHKMSRAIFAVGEKLSKKRFLPIDFKKGGGFARSIQAAKKHNLYRQKYCGCIYSAARI